MGRVCLSFTDLLSMEAVAWGHTRLLSHCTYTCHRLQQQLHHWKVSNVSAPTTTGSVIPEKKSSPSLAKQSRITHGFSPTVNMAWCYVYRLILCVQLVVLPPTDNLEAMQEKSRSLWEKITGRRKPRLGEKH